MTGVMDVRGRVGPARTLLTRAVVLTALTAALAVVLAALVRGGPGGLGAAAGGTLVLCFLLVGQLPVAQVARGRRRLGVALLVVLFVVRLMVLVVGYGVVVTAPGAVDRDALGLTVIGAALAWTAGTVWSALRWRPILVEPDGPPERDAGGLG